MSKYDKIIFDLDGTLIDTSKGIINCYNYTARLLGVDELAYERFRSIIGSPLITGFSDHFNMPLEMAKKAVLIYREQYEKRGLYEAKVYAGIENMLIELKKQGYKTAVATLKLDKFAKIILAHFALDKYFDVINGIDSGDSLSKSQLINQCINYLTTLDKKKAILVGDSEYDAFGAKESKIDFIRVTYGWGFQNSDQVKQLRHVYIAKEPNDILEYLNT